MFSVENELTRIHLGYRTLKRRSDNRRRWDHGTCLAMTSTIFELCFVAHRKVVELGHRAGVL